MRNKRTGALQAPPLQAPPLQAPPLLPQLCHSKLASVSLLQNRIHQHLCLTRTRLPSGAVVIRVETRKRLNKRNASFNRNADSTMCQLYHSTDVSHCVARASALLDLCTNKYKSRELTRNNTEVMQTLNTLRRPNLCPLYNSSSRSLKVTDSPPTPPFLNHKSVAVGGQDHRTNTPTVLARSLGTLGLCFPPSQIVSLTMGTTLEQKENNQAMINVLAHKACSVETYRPEVVRYYQSYTFNHTGTLNQSFPLLIRVDRGDSLKRQTRERNAIRKSVQ